MLWCRGLPREALGPARVQEEFTAKAVLLQGSSAMLGAGRPRGQTAAMANDPSPRPVHRLTGSDLTCEALEQAARLDADVALCEGGASRMAAARSLIDEAVDQALPVYGVTTGLGAKVGEVLSGEALAAFSWQTLRGRAHAVGAAMPADQVRAAMIVRLNTFLRGAAGVSPDVARHLEACLRAGLAPVVGETASVGAGDLVWNATWALALMGEGPIADATGTVRPGAEALAAAGIAPPELGPRDGLALANNASFSAALATLGVARAARLFEAVQTAAALSMEGFRANLSPLDADVLALRPQPGQEEAAAGLRERLAGSGLWQEGAARRLQDPLSLRNIVQVHGAVHAALGFAREAAEMEINGASDNPVVLVDQNRIVSGGAYHTPHLTNAVETLSRALVQLTVMQLARISKMVSARFTDLPLFLARPEGNSNGFAPVMKTAEALAMEVVHAAAPAPQWSSINADGVEDSMTGTPTAAKALLRLLGHARRLCALELIVAAQAVDLRGAEVAPGMRMIHGRIRGFSPRLVDDRPLGGEIDAVAEVLDEAVFSP